MGQRHSSSGDLSKSIAITVSLGKDHGPSPAHRYRTQISFLQQDQDCLTQSWRSTSKGLSSAGRNEIVAGKILKHQTRAPVPWLGHFPCFSPLHHMSQQSVSPIDCLGNVISLIRKRKISPPVLLNSVGVLREDDLWTAAEYMIASRQ